MVSDDEPTRDDIQLRSPYAGPPTIEEQISPFHVSAQPGSTIQGMPAAQLPEPVITSRQPADPGAPPAMQPPHIIHAPSPQAGAMPPDGPTVPDGLPSLMSSPTPVLGAPADFGLDDVPTDPFAGRHFRGSVPSPDDPNIQISKSMEYDVSHLKDGPPADPKQAPRVSAARRAVAQPTEVMLPALGRKKKKKERSDAWLVLGLLFLVMVIFGLIGAVIFGVVQKL